MLISCSYSQKTIWSECICLVLYCGVSGKEHTSIVGDVKRLEFNPRVRKIPRRRERQPTRVILPVESLGQRSLAAPVHRFSKLI